MTPRPAYVPGRTDVPNHQPGNPLYQGPGMAPPPWNPGGLLPGVVTPRGLERWNDKQTSMFALSGGNQVWTYTTTVLDLRPGATQADGRGVRAFGVNHEAALGAGIYLTMLISGVTPPAAIPGMTCTYVENGNNVGEDLRRLTQDAEITDLVQGGGTRLTAPIGASMLNFTPSQPGLRFWQVSVTFTIPGVGSPTAYGLFVQCATN